ncbi:SusC/RagA family TonB-linked outer membrane protein [Aridibaculum aurantiacum]|uniref:SusC/RagA family TonB-linked outer membrane protein n=1 Tax=Aridibaculum aurantiacum TaxID=2810307 RepID=UPI001A95D47E|nr:TonB-dependent receptor [Aridibaculum aurantiacum]
MNVYLKSIVIALCLCIAYTGSAQSPNTPITAIGTIIDINKKPLEGVQIYLQEKTSGVVTGTDGKFSIKCNSTDVLIFKKEGYNTLIKNATAFLGGEVMMIESLVEAGDDDNVFIPFGVRKKRAVTASISTIKGTELPQLPLSTLNNALAGRLPGLYVRQMGTRPGTDDANFLIRGRSSFNDGQQPLVLVDGVERDFANMDISEIEGISVLKDAASLSWYGMRGANGVIYVTTKRGSPTSTRVTLDVQGGVQTPQHMTRPLDSYTYATLVNQAAQNDGNAPRYNQAALDAYKSGSNPYLYPNNNFVDQFIKPAAPVQRYVATVSGGNAFAKYYTVLSFFNQDGLYKGANNDKYNANTNYKRYNFRTNLNLHINKSLDVILDVGGRVENLRYPFSGNATFLNTVYNTPANAFPIKNENGSYGGSALFRNNPLAMLNEDGNVTDLYRTLLATVDVRQKLDFITKGLTANVFYTYDINGMYQSGFNQSYEVYEFSPTGSSVRFGNKAPLSYRNTGFSGNERRNEFWGGLDYDRMFGQHDFKISSRVQSAVSAQPGRLDNTRLNFANRVSYSFRQKYFADLVAAYSGSQVFAPGRRFGWFPAVSAGWIISEESFLKSVKALDYLKLRASTGTVGSDALGVRRYPYRSYFTRGGAQYTFGTGYTSVANTTELELANPNLTWEKAIKTSAGFDAKLFRQSLSLTFDYFHERRNDLLTPALLPNVLGQTTVNVNEGKAEYKGFEAGLLFTKKVGAFTITLNGNYTHANSKILAINEEAGLPEYQKQIGQPIGNIVHGSNFLRRFLIAEGLFQSQAEIDAAPVQRLSGTVRPGDIRYKDVNGDGQIDFLDFVMTDYTDIPPTYFGFGSSISVKNFDISFQFQGINGRSIQINDLINSGTAATGFINQFSVDAWTPSNPTAKYPRLTSGDRGNNTANSTFWIRSGDYMRLKAAEVGYSLPASTLKRMNIRSARVYISGFNLLTFSKLKDLPIDPEMPTTGYGSNYPYLKTFAAGLTLNF